MGGRVVVRDRVLLTVDEAAFRSKLAEIMVGFRRDFDQVARTNAAAVSYLLDANRRVGAMSLGVNRLSPRPEF